MSRELERQFESDKKEMKLLTEEYGKWQKKCEHLLVNTHGFYIETASIIDRFNKFYEETIPHLDEGIRIIVKGRHKGIGILLKMMKKAADICENIFRNYTPVSFKMIENFDSVSSKNLEEIRLVLNENYNIIWDVRREKDKLINKFFDFLKDDIFNISDGIDAGKKALKAKESIEDLYFINEVYNSLGEVLLKYLDALGINVISVSKGDAFDANSHEPFDVEITSCEEEDEKIYEVISKGFEFEEDIYLSGFKYIVRPSKVIVNKFKNDREEGN